MVKFIIGTDAFSDPDSLEESEFITHTEFPRFMAEIIFIESDDDYGFTVETLNVLWQEPCEKRDLDTAIAAARKAIDYYTEKSMALED